MPPPKQFFFISAQKKKVCSHQPKFFSYTCSLNLIFYAYQFSTWYINFKHPFLISEKPRQHPSHPVHWKIHFLQGTRIKRPCLSGHPVLATKHRNKILPFLDFPRLGHKQWKSNRFSFHDNNLYILKYNFVKQVKR